MPEIRSILFVDFDNIFSSLKDLDRVAALAFAQEPGVWLERLRQHGLPDGTRRRFLQCRAYLNPAGWVPDEQLGNDSGRLYLQRFRPNFTNAGFEVIDCPALTQRHKNAADIRMVVDILSSLASDLPFDELVIASSDADFTPLLQVLRARDRRMLVLSAGETAPAYRSVADAVVGPEPLIALMRGSDPDPSQPAPPAPDDPKGLAERILIDRLEEIDGPMLLSHLGIEIRAAVGAAIEETSWFGHGTLSSFARSVGGGRFQTSGHHAWDPERHEAPIGPTAVGNRPGVPPLVADIRAITELPPLPSRTWPALFETLAQYARNEVFNLTTCTSRVRDQLRETDTPVSRNVVGFVVRGASSGGAKLDRSPPPDADEIRGAVAGWISDRCESAGRPLSDTEARELSAWLAGAWEGDPSVSASDGLPGQDGCPGGAAPPTTLELL